MINPELKERPFEQFIMDLETALNDKVEADARQQRKYNPMLALVFFWLGIFWRTIFDLLF